jgi:hypothetical protein
MNTQAVESTTEVKAVPPSLSESAKLTILRKKLVGA